MNVYVVLNKHWNGCRWYETDVEGIFRVRENAETLLKELNKDKNNHSWIKHSNIFEDM